MTVASRAVLSVSPRVAARVSRTARATGVDSWTAADQLVSAALDREDGRDPAQVARVMERFALSPGGTAAEIRARGIAVAAEIDGADRLVCVGGEWRWASERRVRP